VCVCVCVRYVMCMVCVMFVICMCVCNPSSHTLSHNALEKGLFDHLTALNESFDDDCGVTLSVSQFFGAPLGCADGLIRYAAVWYGCCTAR